MGILEDFKFIRLEHSKSVQIPVIQLVRFILGLQRIQYVFSQNVASILALIILSDLVKVIFFERNLFLNIFPIECSTGCLSCDDNTACFVCASGYEKKGTICIALPQPTKGILLRKTNALNL